MDRDFLLQFEPYASVVRETDEVSALLRRYVTVALASGTDRERIRRYLAEIRTAVLTSKGVHHE